jgi:hypothetical protein
VHQGKITTNVHCTLEKLIKLEKGQTVRKRRNMKNDSYGKKAPIGGNYEIK